MPRRAPDGQGVTEHRITLGNWERNLIADTKEDIEKTVILAGLTAVAMPVGVAIGGGLLGYGIYRGLDSFSFGAAKKLSDWWQRQKDSFDLPQGHTQKSLLSTTIYFFTGGYFGAPNPPEND